MIIDKFKKNNKSRGSLLFELLIVISLLAVILSVGANAVFLSLRSNKTSGERDVASGLASETLEAVRSTVEENWQNIYSLTKSTGHYYPLQSVNKWTLTSGDQVVTLNNIAYTRYITVDNVSRDYTTRNIQSSYSGADDDPSTQKVTVKISWAGGNSITLVEYFFRWKNKICAQTSWVTGGSGNTVKNCPDTTYDVKDDALIDISTGSIKLK